MNRNSTPAAAPLVERVQRLLEDPEAALALGAALRARAAGATDALVLAALLHQVADDGTGEPRLAAAWLGRTFGPAVSEPVRLLGEAERWLATVDRAWFEALDAGGLASLREHGGPLGPMALRSFERRPYAMDAVRLLRWLDAERRAGQPSGQGLDALGWPALVERLVSDDSRLTA